MEDQFQIFEDSEFIQFAFLLHIWREPMLGCGNESLDVNAPGFCSFSPALKLISFLCHRVRCYGYNIIGIYNICHVNSPY